MTISLVFKPSRDGIGSTLIRQILILTALTELGLSALSVDSPNPSERAPQALQFLPKIEGKYPLLLPHPISLLIFSRSIYSTGIRNQSRYPSLFLLVCLVKQVTTIEPSARNH